MWRMRSVLVVAVLSGCSLLVDSGSYENGARTDAGPDASSPIDAGSLVDAGARVDTGAPEDDAGPVAVDAGGDAGECAVVVEPCCFSDADCPRGAGNPLVCRDSNRAACAPGVCVPETTPPGMCFTDADCLRPGATCSVSTTCGGDPPMPGTCS